MKLLRTYKYKSNNDYARWIEFPYANKAMDLWDDSKLEICPPYFDYTPETVVPIKLNPFQR